MVEGSTEFFWRHSSIIGLPLKIAMPSGVKVIQISKIGNKFILYCIRDMFYITGVKGTLLDVVR